MPASSPVLFESLAAYRDFRDRLDQLTAEAAERYGSQMQCKAGCSKCCRGDFRISLVEAVSLRLAIEQLSSAETIEDIKRNLSQDNTERCPLLINDKCSVYAERPVLCRIFGFPISNGQAIATCELNFKDAQQETQHYKCFDQPLLMSTLVSISELCRSEFANAGMPLPSDESLPAFRIQEVLEGMLISAEM